MKKAIRNSIITIISLCLIWSAMVITDYVRCKSFKEPIFTIGTNRDQNGNGYYKCIGYEIRAVAREFNGNKFVVPYYTVFGKKITAHMQIIPWDPRKVKCILCRTHRKITALKDGPGKEIDIYGCKNHKLFV